MGKLESKNNKEKKFKALFQCVFIIDEIISLADVDISHSLVDLKHMQDMYKWVHMLIMQSTRIIYSMHVNL